MIGGSFLIRVLWSWQKQSLLFSISKYCRRESNFHRGLLLSFFGQRFGDAKFAAFAELRDGAEEALRRFWGAQRRAQFHHGLIPIARRFRVEESVR